MSKPSALGHRFSRRSLLRGLGAGTAMLAPFVRHRASLAAPSGPPGNLIIFYTPNGHKRKLVVDSNQSSLAFDASPLAGGLALGRSLVPLNPFQRDIAVIKGLNLKTSTFIASHQDICRILTCWNAPIEGNDQAQFTAFGPSIDQTIGLAFNQKPLVVAVDPYRDVPSWRTLLSWSASGVNAPFVKDHQAVFTDLFGGVTGPGQMALARLRARNAPLADYLRSDIAILGKRVSRAQRPTPAPMCTPNDLQARITALPVPAPVQNDDKSAPGQAAQMQARGELWMDMIATAFACGTQRVAVIQWQGASEGYDPVADEGSPTHHSVSSGSAPAQHWADIDAWYASRFAYQLNALQRLGILDRTIVAWVTEITEGHNQCNMVVVVAGGQALGMKMGQYIQYPFTGQEVEGAESIPIARNPANRSLADLWVTIQQALGVNQSTFGDPKWSAGPLTELRG
jgi:hypothetical protein